MEKSIFYAMSSSLKALSLVLVMIFAVQSANAWVGESIGLTRALTELADLKRALDPVNPSPYMVAKMTALQGIVVSLSIEHKTLEEAYTSNVVFDTTGTPATPTAIPAVGVDIKALTGELYTMFQ